MPNNSDRLIGYNNETLDTHRLLVSFNKNDFWYNSTNADISNNLPTREDCLLNNVYDNEWENTRCKNISSGDNNQECVRRELCLNRDYGEKLDKLQNNHNGSDQNYLDTKQKYSYEFLQSINLGVGIVGVVFVIFAFYRNRNIV
jgi:hypothetical protein